MCSFLCLIHFAVMWIYPVSQTVKSINSDKPDNIWLSYWLLRGLVWFVLCNILHVIWDYMYGFYLVETVICIWLVHPDFRGAEFISETVYELVFANMNEIISKTPILGFIEDGGETGAPKAAVPKEPLISRDEAEPLIKAD
jgi:hypothetical protein